MRLWSRLMPSGTWTHLSTINRESILLKLATAVEQGCYRQQAQWRESGFLGYKFLSMLKAPEGVWIP